MYLYQPCLLSMALYAWAFSHPYGKGRWVQVFTPLVILCVSEWEFTISQVYIYPAAVFLPTIFLIRREEQIAWAEALTGSLLGGLLCWKAADTWPLLHGLTLWCAVLSLVPVVVLCRKREDRLLAWSLEGLFFELFFCMREYMLFSFCVVRLGSRDALSLNTTSLCIYFVLEGIHQAIRVKATGPDYTAI